jgi:hypothetical protein
MAHSCYARTSCRWDRDAAAERAQTVGQYTARVDRRYVGLVLVYSFLLAAAAAHVTVGQRGAVPILLARMTDPPSHLLPDLFWCCPAFACAPLVAAAADDAAGEPAPRQRSRWFDGGGGPSRTCTAAAAGSRTGEPEQSLGREWSESE